MFVFMKCVAAAIVEKGVRGLAEMVPGGGFAYDVAQAALGKYREKRQTAEMRVEIRELAQASFEQARQAAIQAAREVTGGAATDDELISLELYLSQIPGAVRHSLKRAEDSTGTTVPTTFALNSPDDVLKLLPPRPVRFRPGDRLPGKPGWLLIEPLGVGGFGEVWLTRHHRVTSLSGAVKFCHDLQTRDRDLLHESRVIDRVMEHGKHPHIVPLLDAHLDGDSPWLMFEYVRGGDLADVIHEWQALPKNERLVMATTALQELAAAVGHFHRLTPAVVHRDLKPANILRDQATGKLRVTDFGIGGVAARLVLEIETRAAMTQSGRLLSCLRGSYTPLYASPQQREGGDPDPLDDVHALGVIGYQMITGQLNQGAGPDFADDLRDAGVGEDLISLLGRCVAQRANRRPKDAVELAELLAAVSLRPPPQPVPSVPEPSPVPGRKKDEPSSASASTPKDVWRERNLKVFDDAVMNRFSDVKVIVSTNESPPQSYTVPLIMADPKEAAEFATQGEKIKLPLLALHSPRYILSQSRGPKGLCYNISYSLWAWAMFTNDMDQITGKVLATFPGDGKTALRIPGDPSEVELILDDVSNNLDSLGKGPVMGDKVIKYRFNLTAKVILPVTTETGQDSKTTAQQPDLATVDEEEGDDLAER